MVGKEQAEDRERRKQMMTDRSRAEPQYSDEKEYCVLCGRLTEAAKDQQLSERKHYIEGAGQLCRECYRKLYLPRHDENVVQLVSRNISENWFL